MLKMLIFRFVVFIVARGVSCHLTVTDVDDKVTYVGNDITLPCLVEAGGFDVFHNPIATSQNITITWQHRSVNSASSTTLLSLQITPQPKIVKVADAIKYVNMLKDASLTIREVEFVDAGVYTCSVHRGNEVKNDTADLFVMLQPQCRNLKPSLTYHGDEETFFDCVVHYKGNKPPLLLWKHDEQELSSQANRHNDSCVISTLSFRAERKYNGYRFQCIIEYPSAKFLSVCQTNPPLQILFPVSVTKMLIEPDAEKHVYKAGENILLDCQANGNPQPKYNWYFKAKGDKLKETELVSESRYKIFNAGSQDEGTYNCTVTNSVNGRLYRDSKTIYIKIIADLVKHVPKDFAIKLGFLFVQPCMCIAYCISITLYPIRTTYSVDTCPRQGTPDLYKDGPFHTGGGYRYILVQSTDQVKDNTNKTDSTGKISPFAIGAIICAIIAVVLILVLVVLAMKFRDQCFLKEKKAHERLAGDHDENMDDQEVELLDENVQPRMSSEEPQYGRLKLYWEIPRKDIKLSNQIGTGTFVEVWKGKMKKSPDGNDVQKVAIKKLKDNAVEQERKFFLDEMEVQKMLQPHPNVILLIGCYTFHEPWLLMLELAQEGTLFQYLQNSRPGIHEVEIKSGSVRHKIINSHKLLALAAQVVNGLIHLLKFKLVYYRLKASNILVGRGGICKLSGFGFPHDITERNLYEINTLPLSWMSPESIQQNIYNYKTDVWSYGVLLWEIVHFGLTPYPGLEQTEIKDKILSGERLIRPQHCSEDLYALMTDCWQEEPAERKDYEDILQDLSNLASNHSLHILFDNLPFKFQQAV